MKENRHSQSVQEVVKEFDTDLEKGLKREDIQKRKERYGENALQSKAKKTLFAMIVDQFKDFMILILIIAALISIVLGDAFEGAVILGIVVLNAILGTYQENKASNALAALKNMAAPKAKVIRDHHIMSISSKDLVPGDLVVLEAGDYIPADVRLVESVNLKVDESALTGESVAVEKDAKAIVDSQAALGDRINSGYMSTIVTYGRGKAVVIGTGMDTEIGQIATMLDATEDTQTPLQNKLAQFGKYLGIICIAVSAVIFALGIMRGEDLFEIFMIAVSLAVAAIPEGLPAVVTVVLAMGMQRMIKRHAIVKQLSAVETLGSTSTICTDKTGTLTQNKMTVQKVFNGYEAFDVTGTGYGFDGEILTASGHDAKEQIQQLLRIAALCNDADFDEGDVVGDPTEGALLVLGQKGGVDYQQMNKLHPRLKEYPFDSQRKLMSTLHKFEAQHLMFTKGAPDVILKRSTKILQNNEIVDLTQEKRNELLQINKKYAEQALRVLGYAYKPVSEDAKLEDEEQELIFTGLSGMIDPPREEVKDAIKLCKKAGIRVVMITGDHIITASAIGRQIGVIDDESQAMEGARIDKYSDEELQEAVKNTNIFARVSPEHKVRIVRALRASGEVVSMTGDGVNDAPALKQADIGVAMGITGTDVSKEAADMILTDDNFASIVDAVEEGRIIYSNIRKFVGFLLSCNIGEILIIFLAILMKWPVPLLPIQLLWVNLVTDSFPAFALGLEEGGEGIMDQKPRDKDEPIVNRTMQVSIAIQSLGLMTATLISFRIGLNSIADGAGAEALARTFCFVTLIIGEMLRAYSARSEHKPLWTMRVFSNRYLNLSVTGAVIMLLGVIYLPGISTIFSTVALSIDQLLIAMGLGIIPTIFSEVGKQINMLGAKKVKKLIITEKPSVARDIAKVLNIRTRKDGYMEGEGYVITWAVGHLVTLYEPQDYDESLKRWSYQSLPIIPESIKIKPYPQTKKQLKIIQNLCDRKDVDSLICATDSGREGELIFRYIYDYVQSTKPFSRLWISSMTDEAIKEGFDNLKDGKEYNRLYLSAKCRSESDWLVGINATRAYTTLNNTLLSIGRVQTPTLALVVNRYHEIQDFKPRDYYEVIADYGEFKGTWYKGQISDTKIDVLKEAETIAEKVKDQEGQVIDIEKKNNKQKPPFLYDLTELQRDGNRQYGYTATQVLEYAQNLYEKRKLITYPRTDSRFLSDDMKDTVVKTMHTINVMPYSKAIAPLMKEGKLQLRFTKRIINNSKITDHHAIIPTNKNPENIALSPQEKNIYQLVVKRFIAVFYGDYTFKTTKIMVKVCDETFVSKGKIIGDLGWKKLYQKMSDQEEETLPNLKKNDRVHVCGTQVQSKQTSPPKPYTEATLLSAMENAGRFVEEEDLKEQLKEAGFGTPATRAGIIERLISVKYIYRKGKSLYPTEKGIKLIQIIPDELKSPEMTGKWERGLTKISQDKLPVAPFMASINRFVAYLVKSAEKSKHMVTFEEDQKRKSNYKIKGKVYGPCPLCGEGKITVNSKAYYCSRFLDGCKFTLWKNALEPYGTLTEAMVEHLLNQGKIEVFDFIQPQTKEEKTATLELEPGGRLQLKNVNLKSTSS